ncbi:MAG: Cyclopropane-fatty-acyl-phospholipid synthase [Deltaproteobacteria bacterium]|nr:Cyclopropane-fatty-acyl-phospholipid synthase [Deltaproteobacteria bacterium]
MSDTEAILVRTAHVPLRYRVAAKLVMARLARWSAGLLTLRLPDGTAVQFGGAAAERRVSIAVKDWKFFWRVLTAGDIGVGESYMAGEWTCSDLVELFRQFLHDQSVLAYRWSWRCVARLRHWALRLLSANTLSGSRRNIQYHYDLSNDLYRLFLDESMTYSCALFERQDMTLREAQERKLDDICRRLDLSPGLRVLEIGSGWGAFALYAARHYGCQVTSLTLSEQQRQLARERVRAAGLEASVDVRLCDYREVTGRYDRIVSIEMFEAVGYEYYGAFFTQCCRLLKPGGRMLLQTITVPDQRFDTYRREFDWIKKYIFPGGLLASFHAIVETLKRRTDFRVEWVRDIGLHYVHTLRWWREQFLSRLPEVRGLGFDERFIRMWEFYLASCEAAFSVRYIGDLQIVLARPPVAPA